MEDKSTVKDDSADCVVVVVLPIGQEFCRKFCDSKGPDILQEKSKNKPR